MVKLTKKTYLINKMPLVCKFMQGQQRKLDTIKMDLEQDLDRMHGVNLLRFNKPTLEI